MSDLLTCNGILCCIDLLLLFLNEQSNSSRIPFRKFRLKNAYKSGLTPELKYVTRNVNGVNSALKLESPRYVSDLFKKYIKFNYILHKYTLKY